MVFPLTLAPDIGWDEGDPGCNWPNLVTQASSISPTGLHLCVIPGA